MDDKINAPLQSDQKEENVVTEQKPQEPSDQLTPEHPRFKQVIEKLHQSNKTIEELQEQLASLKESVNQRQEQTGQNELTDDERIALEKIDRQLKARGYVTKEELESSNRIEKRAIQIEKLSDKYDGTNGYPKFVAEDIIEFAEERGLRDNLEDAYFMMHRPTIIDIEAKKRFNTPNVPSSEKPTGGSRQAPIAEFTPEQIAQMSDEEWAKNESKIMSAFKASVTGK